MTLTDKGFFSPSKDILINGLAGVLDTILGHPIDRSPGSAVMMIVRMAADRVLSDLQNLEDYSHMQSVQEAIGVFAEYFGLENNIEIGPATKATGGVRITGQALGSPYGDIPLGSAFSTPTGNRYLTTEAGVIPNIVGVIHQEDNVDSVPFPYSGISADKIERICRYSDGSSPYSQGSPGWEVTEEDVIEWTGSYPDTPLTNAPYYIVLKVDSEINVDVSVVAEEAGTSYNTSENTITVNEAGLSAVTSVTNPIGITNASDEESLDSFKNRILAMPFRDWTREKCREEVRKIVGVRTVQIVDYEGIDQFDPDDWTDTTPIGTTEYKLVDESTQFGQMFRSGEMVHGFSSVTFRIYPQDALATDDLNVALYTWKGNYEDTIAGKAISQRRISAKDLDQDLLYEYQDYRIPLSFGGLDRTFRYVIRAWMDGGSSGGWRIVYNTSAVQTLGLFTKVGTDPAIQSTTTSLMFKTAFSGGGYTCYISPVVGYTYESLESDVEDVLKQYTAMGMDHTTTEAETVPINTRCRLVLSEGYELSDVGTDIETRIGTYINNLPAGENVVWAKIMAIIMATQGVLNVVELELTRSRDDPLGDWTNTDIPIAIYEVAIMGEPGTTFTV